MRTATRREWMPRAKGSIRVEQRAIKNAWLSETREQLETLETKANLEQTAKISLTASTLKVLKISERRVDAEQTLGGLVKELDFAHPPMLVFNLALLNAANSVMKFLKHVRCIKFPGLVATCKRC